MVNGSRDGTEERIWERKVVREMLSYVARSFKETIVYLGFKFKAVVMRSVKAFVSVWVLSVNWNGLVVWFRTSAKCRVKVRETRRRSASSVAISRTSFLGFCSVVSRVRDRV